MQCVVYVSTSTFNYQEIVCISSNTTILFFTGMKKTIRKNELSVAINILFVHYYNNIISLTFYVCAENDVQIRTGSETKDVTRV